MDDEYSFSNTDFEMSFELPLMKGHSCMAYPTTSDHPQYGNPDPDPPKPKPGPPKEEE